MSNTSKFNHSNVTTPMKMPTAAQRLARDLARKIELEGRQLGIGEPLTGTEAAELAGLVLILADTIP